MARPLVERTNELSIRDFISEYVSSSCLEIRSTGLATDAQDQSADRNGWSSMNGVYPVDIYTAQTISAADFNACFHLIELTVSDSYARSAMGWSASKKRREMRLPDMKYLILRPGSTGSASVEPDECSRNGQLLGFLSFMVTYEDRKEVLYCYEIHLSPEAQGQGLGNQLMMLYEGIGQRIGLEKVMLTVFKSNTRAIRFYERLGYVVDEYSPPVRILRNNTVKESEYLILSKPLKSRASHMA